MAKGAKRSAARRKPARRRSAAARPHVLVHLSSDWYWEQDASLRFTKVDVRHTEAGEQALSERILGKKRWETGIEIEGGWEAHRALLEARAPFRDVLMWRSLPDGSRRYVHVTGEPVFDAKGRFTGYRGIGRDVTKQRRIQQLLKLDQLVTRRLADAPGAREAFRGALQAICETEGWDNAELWKLDEAAGVLRRFVDWCRPDDVEAQRFAEASRDLVFAPGAGLVGGVCQSGEPEWLDGAAILPVRSGGRVAAVLNFHCRLIRPPDKRLLQALNAIATQIGQFLQRAEAEQAVRESEARFRSLTNLSSDWYWEQDAELRFTRLEGRLVAGGDPVLRERLIGTRRWESGLEIEGGWDAHRALLNAREPFYNVLMWRSMSDGSLRYVSVSGEPVLGADGAFAGYRGVGRDITVQKRAEQLLVLEHEVAHALATAEDAASGLKAVIRAVCEAEGWACGRYFRVDQGSLRFQDAWSIADPLIEQFVERSRSLTFASGQGLSGLVWRSGEPLWVQDTLKDPRVHTRTLWEITKLHGAFVFPILAENRVIGVLNFSSHAVREPDLRWLQASRVIGSQVGQFLQRKQAEESLRESESRFRSLTQMSSDFFWETDAAHRMAQLVQGPHYAMSHMGGGVVGKAAWELPAESPDEPGWAAHRATLDQHVPFRDFEFARRMPDGQVRYFAVSGEPRFAADGGFLGYRGVGRDITEIALARDRIESLAYSDPLTGLANRTSLVPSLEQAVQRSRRRNSKLAVVFIDLDGFKQINDFLGHDSGDALLVELAGRLRAHLRASDLVARLGGDEFLAVLEEVPDSAAVASIAKKLLAEVARPYSIAGARALVTGSVGISVFPDDASDAAALMKHADIAMYAAKQKGKNTYCFYTDGPASNDPAQPAEKKA